MSPRHDLEETRAVATIFVIAAIIVAGLSAGGGLANLALFGILGVAAATVLLVLVLGLDPWARGAVTLAGAIGGLVTVLAASAEPLEPFAFGSLVCLGLAGSVLQYALPRPSAPLAAVAAAMPVVAGVDRDLGLAVSLLGLIACSGVVYGVIKHVWHDHRDDDQATYRQEPIGETQVEEPAMEQNADRPRLREDKPDYPPPDRPRHVKDKRRKSAAPYVTIGDNPKLLRSAEVSPPRVEYSAPAGHQFDGFRQEDLVIRAASHVGTAHMQQRRVRQDAYAISATNDGRYVMAAVADGVGSESHSSLGADWAASSAVGYGIDSYDNYNKLLTAAEMVQFAADEVRNRAELFGKGTSEMDFSTTLVVAVVGAGADVGQLARVGDSAAFTRSDSGWHPVFSDGSPEPDAPTNAIPSDHPIVESQELSMFPGECVLLVSDGIGDLLTHTSDVRRALFGALAEPLSPLEFSALTGFQRRQAHDDQTALCVWRWPTGHSTAAKGSDGARHGH